MYGESLARFKPKVYTITFICCDIFSLVLQAAGGGLADTAGDPNLAKTGINIMIAGLAFQVASLTLFVLLVADFAWHIRSYRGVQRVKDLACSKSKFHFFKYGKWFLDSWAEKYVWLYISRPLVELISHY